jgi:hypothetical protein
VNRKFWVGLFLGFGLALVLLFGLRLAHELRRAGLPPAQQPLAASTDASLIRGWMTIPYIAHTYGVPDKVLFDTLNIPEKENRRKSLLELNNEYFPEQEGFVMTRIQEAILAFQGQVPLPPLPPTPPTP